MKKRNVMTMALSLAMVGVIGVGSTLAYLSDTDNKVTNTFKFASDIEVELWEEQPTPVLDESISGGKETGWNYTNVTPGQTLNKAPEFSVTTTVDAYVFARVTESSNVEVNDYNTAAGEWTPLEVEGLLANQKVFYKLVKAPASEKNLGTLFDAVTAATESTSTDTTLGDIVIEVAAVQESVFETPEEAYAGASFQQAQQP